MPLHVTTVAPWIVRLVTFAGTVYLKPVVQVADPDGILTTTVALVLLLDGRAARKSDSLGLLAVHTAVVQVWALAAATIASRKTKKQVARAYFMVNRISLKRSPLPEYSAGWRPSPGRTPRMRSLPKLPWEGTEKGAGLAKAIELLSSPKFSRGILRRVVRARLKQKTKRLLQIGLSRHGRRPSPKRNIESHRPLR